MSANKHQLYPNGTILDDRFEIKEILGAGAFGAVYRARQLVLGHGVRDVALKLFNAKQITAKNITTVFSDAVILISLREELPDEQQDIAKHLIEIYDVGLLKHPVEQAYLSMKLIPGGKTLQSVLRRWPDGKISVQLALRYLRQILVPLAWMHSLDIPAVHADLKPENILLTEASKLVLADFGLAARLPLGAIGGTVTYQAPETLLHHPAKMPADIYSVGVLWYEMLTGHQPFVDVGLEELAAGDNERYRWAHHEARKWAIFPSNHAQLSYVGDPHIPAPSMYNREFLEHPQLELMLKRCLAYKQSERYANAAQLLLDIDKYVKGEKLTHVLPVQSKPSGLELKTKTTQMLLNDAEACLSAGEAKRALHIIDTVLAVHPSMFEALLLQGRALLKEQLFDQAWQLAQVANKEKKNQPSVYHLMADISLALGQKNQARAYRDKANALTPSAPRKY